MSDRPAATMSQRKHQSRRRPAVDGGSRDRFRPSDDVFFAAIELARMPIVLSDPRRPDNPIVFANQAFLAMSGYESDEVVGRNCRFLQGADSDPAVVAALRHAIAERCDFATEILNYRKDGYAFWNALFVAPIFDARGELVYFFGSQLDVTRRREAEESLRQVQKMEALGHLTGAIAHDFNNLLQVMVGYLELIDTGLAKPQIDAAKLGRNIKNARLAADRAAALTQQLLVFSRKRRLEGRTLNLNDLVRSLEGLARRTLGEKVVAEFVLAPDIANCRLDAARMETALLNILINARDAMAKRPERRLTITTHDVVIERGDPLQARNLPAGRYVGIEVADTGIGVPAATIERVMDPFFTAKDAGQGTGLGLSMVYGFVKQSGGVAWIDSSEGAGTVVTMYFPAVSDPASDALPGAAVALDRPGDETILVVEDRRDVAEMACAILRDQGYTLHVADNVAFALDLIEGHRGIDLLFSDILLGSDGDGVALAREARRRDPSLKVLLTTGFAEASLERNDAGGREFDVLNKPYGRLDLIRKIRVVLDGPTGLS